MNDKIIISESLLGEAYRLRDLHSVGDKRIKALEDICVKMESILPLKAKYSYDVSDEDSDILDLLFPRFTNARTFLYKCLKSYAKFFDSYTYNFSFSDSLNMFQDEKIFEDLKEQWRTTGATKDLYQDMSYCDSIGIFPKIVGHVMEQSKELTNIWGSLKPKLEDLIKQYEPLCVF